MAQTAYHGEPAGKARAVCVFLHGRGQSPEQMVAHVLSRLDAPGLRFVLPRAPGAAWYDARAVDAVTPQTLAQLDAALGLVGQAVAEARAENPGVPLIVAGFSQGACLALEYLMRGGRADAAVLLTGCRVGALPDTLPQAALPGLPVYASCGDADPWIPLWAFQRALGDIAASGARLRAEVFPGRPHEVSGPECAEVSRLLTAIAAGTSGLEGTA